MQYSVASGAMELGKRYQVAVTEAQGRADAMQLLSSVYMAAGA